MDQTKDIEIFKKYLLEGNLEGVRNSFQASFLDIILDNKDKRRPIHLACEKGHLEIVKLLIDHAVNIECEYGILKMRPIHLACENGHLEIVKLLTNHKCQFDCKTQDGSTPLVLATENNHDKCVKYLQEIIDNKKIFDCVRRNDEVTLDKLYKSQNLLSLEYDTHLSVLDVAIETNADKIIKYLLDKNINNEELSNLPKNLSRLMQELILYRCIRDNNSKGFELTCSATIINGQRELIQSSILELAAGYGCVILVNEILKKSVYNKDSWQRAKSIANKNGCDQVVRVISEREYVLNIREKSHLSILHTAVWDNEPDMVQYILENQLVNPDANNETFGTALALAYLFSYRDCITILEQFKVNPNTCNKYSQTPLHEAIACRMVDNCDYLLEKVEDIDIPGFMGFTALHCAVMRGFPDLCLQLVKRGADCNRYIEMPQNFHLESKETIEPFTSRETTGTLCLKTHGTIYPCIIDNLNESSVNACDDDNNSLLHLSVQCMQPDICKQLIDIGSMIDPINDKGNSPLLEILSQDYQAIHDNIDKAVAIVQLLSECGADINKVTSTGLTVFQCAAEYGNERLMLALLTSPVNVTNISVEDFKRVFTEKWYNCAEILVSRMDKHSLSLYVTSDIIYSVMKDAPSRLIKVMFNKANIGVQKLVVEDILYKSIIDKDDEMFDYFISENICEPKCFESGENILSMLLKANNTKYCDKLLRSKNAMNFVNLRNAQGQIPLQIALEMRLFDIADHLVFDSDDLNNEDNDGNTTLGQLFAQVSIVNDPNTESRLLVLIKSIITHGGDIYKITSNGRQVISACTNRSIRSNIEIFTEKKQRGAAGPVIERVIEVEKKMCLICTVREVDCVLLQCGHTFCMQCSEEFVRCPVCNADSTEFRRIFLN